MSTLPPPVDPSDDDADEQYRRASGLDSSRPSEATRRAVLAHAARLAAERTRRSTLRRWLSGMGAVSGWRPAIAGTIVAAVLAGILIAPQFLAPTGPTESRQAPAVVPPQAPGAPPPAAAAPAAPEERAPSAVSASAASTARAPAASADTMQRVVVTGSRNRALPTPSEPAEEAVIARQQEQSAGAGTAARASVANAAAARVAPVRPPQSVQPTAAGDIAADPDALRRAAAAGDLETLVAQLATGTDIDARDAEGRTALLLATLNGQASAAAVLLAHGADPSAADAHGTTPLRAAIAADEREIIAMLRRYGAR